jgi:hypothetical protein
MMRLFKKNPSINPFFFPGSIFIDGRAGFIAEHE